MNTFTVQFTATGNPAERSFTDVRSAYDFANTMGRAVTGVKVIKNGVAEQMTVTAFRFVYGRK